MERKEALKYIKDRINEGQPIHMIYKELLPQVQYKNDLLNYISEFMDLKTQNENRMANGILVALLVLVFVLRTFVCVGLIYQFEAKSIPWYILKGQFYFLFPVALIFLIKYVMNFMRTGYKVVILLSISFLIGNFDYAYPLASLVENIPLLVAVYIAYSIYRKGFPLDRLWGGLNRERLEAFLITERYY